MLLFVYSVLQGSCLHGEDKLGRRAVGREGGREEGEMEGGGRNQEN